MASLGRALAMALIVFTTAGCGISEPPTPEPEPEPAPSSSKRSPEPPQRVQTPVPTSPPVLLGTMRPGDEDSVFAPEPGLDPQAQAEPASELKIEKEVEEKEKEKEERPRRRLTRAESALVGDHVFGVQFIWDHYGSATIAQNDDGDLWIRGEQRHEQDFVTVEGRVRVVDAKTLEIKGTLDTHIAGCCGHQKVQSTFRLRRSGKRAYWRLQEPHRGRLCDKYTCHYYVDLFEGAPPRSAQPPRG